MNVSARNSKSQAFAGLTSEEILKMITVFRFFKEVESVILFGSRAMGNFKRGSDVDLALLGLRVDEKTLFQVHHKLEEETLLPYFFDVLIYEKVTNSDLLKHIDKYGKIIYKK